MTRPIVALDCETTSLDADRQPWEVALVRREADGTQQELVIMLPVDLSTADKTSLSVGGFWERHPDGRYLSGLDSSPVDPTVRGEPFCGAVFYEHAAAAELVATWTHDATIVGAVPSFDTATLAPLLRRHKLPGEPWHHRLRCVESMTAGRLGRPVGGLADCLTALGLDFPEPGPHTALGDARAALAIWDHLTDGEG